ncbi:unnamed protein product [Spodoptera littoralis]|uniref:Uncharacterized protein n=1 Tax=Spodoptera littoralis TaxID=7109 RepID=A0A9P0IM81_SPOLI|nr:unnamed protein product [Spodoptera littoralis]CAH1647558.1 unnamed protein product [Spodoptera littoralis]
MYLVFCYLLFCELCITKVSV